MLTTLDRLSEDVVVLAVVVTELELSDVQRQILAADLMERADHAALHQRPEAFNGLGVDRTDNVLVDRVVNELMRVVGIELVVTAPCRAN
jgi:hypothetical protein